MSVPASGVERSRDVGAWAVLALSGDFGLAAVPWVREVVGELVAEGRVHLVWDLSEVSFMDSAGLGVLVAAVRSVEARQGEVRLAGASPQVCRLLELTGLDAVIGVYADVPSAAGPAAG
ncbi:STAS domain-containing protein [Streptomyces sp. NPDC055210]